MEDEALKHKLLQFMRNEITEHHVYRELSARCRGRNREVLARIAADELRHYQQFRRRTGVDVGPNRLRLFFYLLLARVCGLTFAMKLMENGEAMAGALYEKLLADMPEIAQIIEEEALHERLLLSEIEEESLRHLGSIVLAVNNSLQEFTGIAVGLTFALQDGRAVANTVLISGLAASLAMAASEYLSQKSDGGSEPRHAARAAGLTGVAYLLVVLLIVMPFYLLHHHLAALGVTLALVLAVITMFAFFMATVKELRFRRLFAEILLLAAGVISASFCIGLLARRFLGAAH